MMRSLYAAISGLRNHQVKMDVIGNNIANVNTVGFKSGSVTFQDMLSQTLSGASSGNGTTGGTNPMQVGLGVSTAAISTNFTDGSAQSTGVQTDLAISGQGFFILGDALNQVYSRSGNFTFDASGNLVVPGTGMKVLGWQGDSSGLVNTNGSVTGIKIPVGQSMPAKVSSTLDFAGNLSASALANTSDIATAAAVTAANTLITAANAAVTATAATVTAAPLPAAAATLATTAASSAVAAQTAANAVLAAINTYQATPTAANAAAVQTAVANAVTKAEIAARDAAAVVSSTTSPAAAITAAAAAVTASGLVTKDAVATLNRTSDQPTSINVYDTQGNAYKLNGTLEKTGNNVWSFTPSSTVTDANGVVLANVTTSAPISITFNASGVFQTSTSATIKIDPTGITPASPYSGAGAFTITPDFSTMTQYGTDTTGKMDSTDGYTAGTLTAGGGITISSDGTIVGTFTNGKKMDLAKIAMATFNNPGGLMKEGDSLYSASNNSGTPNVGTAGTGGRGTFTPGSLEMSNVDLAQEFSNMIVTQRGFQANSKVITTTDSMLEELVNLKR